MSSSTASRRRPLLLPLLTAAVALAAASPAAAQQSAARIWNEQLLFAIRKNSPNPPAHARNLFHTAVAMYNAWAAYDPTSVGYLYNEKIATTPTNTELARREAISYAAYVLLKKRFVQANAPVGFPPANIAEVQASFDAKLTEMGYSTAVALAAPTADPSPAELGKRIGYFLAGPLTGTPPNTNHVFPDGFTLGAYPVEYNSAFNSNMTDANSLLALGTNRQFLPNMPLGDVPFGTNPNRWQPLSMSAPVDQGGNPLPGGIQGYVGLGGMATTPFSLRRTDHTRPWIDPFGGPSILSVAGAPSTTDAAYKDNFMDVLRKGLQLSDDTLQNYSPGAYGDNTLGLDDGNGVALNPVSGQPYTTNLIRRSDFTRVLAEYWADGPNSETPPGHWHVLANNLADNPQFQKRIRGTGPVLGNLEWDVKMYLAVSAATHDAACAAWSLKRYYSGPRPITAIRYMGSKGQSSNPGGPSYHSEGLPLEPGLVEVITAATVAAGQRHNQIWDVDFNQSRSGSFYLGKVAVFGWPGEHPSNLPAPSIATHRTVMKWMLAEDWLPFQRKTFNTPPFPGYISGHSTFSRAAAESLTLLTGSPYFPGGFGETTIPANSMQIDLGPSADVRLQWCTYYDAADQAGISRRFGGIHPYEDDYQGRQIGSIAGKSAYTLAEQYWTGTILQGEVISPAISFLGNGSVRVTWTPTRGMYHKLQASSTMAPGSWADVPGFTSVLYHGNGAVAADPPSTYTDTVPVPGRQFYRVLRSYTAL